MTPLGWASLFLGIANLNLFAVIAGFVARGWLGRWGGERFCSATCNFLTVPMLLWAACYMGAIGAARMCDAFTANGLAAYARVIAATFGVMLTGWIDGRLLWRQLWSSTPTP